MAESIHGIGDEEADHNFLGKPRDWIDALSRNCFPSRHTHLGDSGCGHSCCQRKKGHSDDRAEDPDQEHDHAHDHGDCEGGDRHRAADEREILPWLKLALELDPKQVQTYIVAAFWLRTSLKQVDQAERLLREAGLADGEAWEALAPLVAGTLDNLRRQGPLAALTGPVARGDVDTLTRHLEALRGTEAELYRRLGEAALELARRRGMDEAVAARVARALATDPPLARSPEA